jgi:hypothetical protein
VEEFVSAQAVKVPSDVELVQKCGEAAWGAFYAGASPALE